MDSHRNNLILKQVSAAIALFFLFHFPSPTHARILIPPSNLLDTVCRKTLNYADCVSALQDDPRIPSASDYKTLARIALEIAATNTTDGKAYIDKMAKSNSTAPILVPALKQCISGYESAALSFDSARAELDEDVETANYDAKVAGDGAVFCETALNSTKLDVPSVTERNYYVTLFSNIGDVITDKIPIVF